MPVATGEMKRIGPQLQSTNQGEANTTVTVNMVTSNNQDTAVTVNMVTSTNQNEAHTMVAVNMITSRSTLVRSIQQQLCGYGQMLNAVTANVHSHRPQL